MTSAPTNFDPALAAALTEWRRHLHAHPELSLHETETAAFVATRLTELGVPFVAGVGGNGIVATISRGQSNRSVGLRADMDALPIEERTGAGYASMTPGVMHACGHDGHTASLLGAAALLSREEDWTGTIQLVFQPAEEGYGGARAMLADGLLERFPMERIFGYHNWPGLAAGEVMVHAGPVMAQGSRVSVTMEGHAGHAAMPHLTRDPVLAAAHALVALQSVVSRNINPMDTAVISICTLDGGMAANQIPQKAVMRGTFRTHRPEVHAQVTEAIERGGRGCGRHLRRDGERRIHHGRARRRQHRSRGRAGPARGRVGRPRGAPGHAALDGERGFRRLSGASPRRLRLDRQWPQRWRAGTAQPALRLSTTRSCPRPPATWRALSPRPHSRPDGGLT